MKTKTGITRNYTSYEQVNTYELNEGDLVFMHGGLFRLETRKDWDTCVSFHADFLGNATSDYACTIPPYWLEDWKLQGNQYATWARITDPSPQRLEGIDDLGVGIWVAC